MDLAEELAVMRLERRVRSRSRDRRNAKVPESDTDTSVVAGAKGSDDVENGDRIKPDTAAEASPTRDTALRRSRSNRARSEFSAYSYMTWATRVSTPWFSESWNVRTARGLDAGDMWSKQASSAQASSASPTIVTELSSESLPHAEAETAAPSAGHRIRSRRSNQFVPSIKPTLKRVVHATYGDLLQSEALKGANPPGFVAVPQSCGSQGDTLFHML